MLKFSYLGLISILLKLFSLFSICVICYVMYNKDSYELSSHYTFLSSYLYILLIIICIVNFFTIWLKPKNAIYSFFILPFNGSMPFVAFKFFNLEYYKKDSFFVKGFVQVNRKWSFDEKMYVVDRFLLRNKVSMSIFHKFDMVRSTSKMSDLNNKLNNYLTQQRNAEREKLEELIKEIKNLKNMIFDSKGKKPFPPQDVKLNSSFIDYLDSMSSATVWLLFGAIVAVTGYFIYKNIDSLNYSEAELKKNISDPDYVSNYIITLKRVLLSEINDLKKTTDTLSDRIEHIAHEHYELSFNISHMISNGNEYADALKELDLSSPEVVYCLKRVVTLYSGIRDTKYEKELIQMILEEKK